MTVSYHSGCFLSQKYPFDYLLFPSPTTDVYKASGLLILPQGREKQNSHFGMKENPRFYNTEKVEHIIFEASLCYLVTTFTR